MHKSLMVPSSETRFLVIGYKNPRGIIHDHDNYYVIIQDINGTQYDITVDEFKTHFGHIPEAKNSAFENVIRRYTNWSRTNSKTKSKKY